MKYYCYSIIFVLIFFTYLEIILSQITIIFKYKHIEENKNLFSKKIV